MKVQMGVHLNRFIIYCIPKYDCDLNVELGLINIGSFAHLPKKIINYTLT